jgi:sodium transport system permease protein
LLQFTSISASGGGSTAGWMIRVLIITQVAVIASPALFMGVMLTTSIKKTFKLRWPKISMLGMAVLLAAALHPLSLEWLHRLAWFFPQLPSAVTKPLEALMSEAIPWWVLLGAMALVPAVCEELAFRGFILSGLRRTGRTWMAIGLSSFAFGMMHMIPQQVFNATLLGIVLSMIAIRSNSLLPCIAFHLTYNALGVMHDRFGDAIKERLGDTLFIRLC